MSSLAPTLSDLIENYGVEVVDLVRGQFTSATSHQVLDTLGQTVVSAIMSTVHDRLAQHFSMKRQAPESPSSLSSSSSKKLKPSPPPDHRKISLSRQIRDGIDQLERSNVVCDGMILVNLEKELASLSPPVFFRRTPHSRADRLVTALEGSKWTLGQSDAGSKNLIIKLRHHREAGSGPTQDV